MYPTSLERFLIHGACYTTAELRKLLKLLSQERRPIQLTDKGIEQIKKNNLYLDTIPYSKLRKEVYALAREFIFKYFSCLFNWLGQIIFNIEW
jgi:hypothetical protein